MQGNKTYENYDKSNNETFENKIELALLKKDLSIINDKITELNADLEKIKSYFIRAFVGAGGIVGLYFIQWLLSGGLQSIIPT